MRLRPKRSPHPETTGNQDSVEKYSCSVVDQHTDHRNDFQGTAGNFTGAFYGFRSSSCHIKHPFWNANERQTVQAVCGSGSCNDKQQKILLFCQSCNTMIIRSEEVNVKEKTVLK